MLRYKQDNPFLFVERGGLEGKNTFSFNQEKAIFTSSKNGMTENFLWDGLALIHRGTTSFINEPYVTGGNPILSSTGDVMFNDMLGSTLGVKGESYSKIDMTAFGSVRRTAEYVSDSDDKAVNERSIFFTGKPNIGELDYAFLFRNYRADQGKWMPICFCKFEHEHRRSVSSRSREQTSDPLGYPDGWNNLAYVNNGVIKDIDPLGLNMLFESFQSEMNFSTNTEGANLKSISVSYESCLLYSLDINLPEPSLGSEWWWDYFVLKIDISYTTYINSKQVSYGNYYASFSYNNGHFSETKFTTGNRSASISQNNSSDTITIVASWSTDLTILAGPDKKYPNIINYYNSINHGRFTHEYKE